MFQIDRFRTNLRLSWEIALSDLTHSYARTAFGRAWIAISPLGLVALYGLVFGVALDVRWPGFTSSRGSGFLLPFLCGLVHFLLVSEVIGAATNVFPSKRAFVQKSSSPLWILPVATWIRAAVSSIVPMVALFVLALGLAAPSVWDVLAAISASILAAAFALGLCFLLSALGAFVGDLTPTMPLVTRVLFYSAPITYPLTLLPEGFQGWLWLNPLTAFSELTRSALVFGRVPTLNEAAVALLSAVLAVGIGITVFHRVKRYVPDVV